MCRWVTSATDTEKNKGIPHPKPNFVGGKQKPMAAGAATRRAAASACRLPRRSPPFGAECAGWACPGSWQVYGPAHCRCCPDKPQPAFTSLLKLQIEGRCAAAARSALQLGWPARQPHGSTPHSSRLGRCAAAAHSRSMSFWR